MNTGLRKASPIRSKSRIFHKKCHAHQAQLLPSVLPTSPYSRYTVRYVFRIETVKPYPYDHMETVKLAQKEQKENARPELEGNEINIEPYDTIILGYPNWWGTMPMAVFTFMESHDFAGKTILPLCTHEGSGMGHSEADIKAVCPDARVERGLAITGCKVSKAGKNIEKWLTLAGLM